MQKDFIAVLQGNHAIAFSNTLGVEDPITLPEFSEALYKSAGTKFKLFRASFKNF